MCIRDSFQGTVLARLAFNELKAKKVSVIQEITNDYSVGLAKFFTDEFTKLGGTVVDGGKYNTGDTDFNAALTTVKSQAPDVIFAPGNFTESALIIKQARQLGLTQPFLGGDTWETPEFITTGGAAVDGAMFTTFFATEQPINDTSKKFIEEYKKEYNKEPSAVAALAFDAYLVTVSYTHLDVYKRQAQGDPDSAVGLERNAHARESDRQAAERQQDNEGGDSAEELDVYGRDPAVGGLSLIHI